MKHIATVQVPGRSVAFEWNKYFPHNKNVTAQYNLTNEARRRSKELAIRTLVWDWQQKKNLAELIWPFYSTNTYECRQKEILGKRLHSNMKELALKSSFSDKTEHQPFWWNFPGTIVCVWNDNRAVWKVLTKQTITLQSWERIVPNNEESHPGSSVWLNNPGLGKESCCSMVGHCWRSMLPQRQLRGFWTSFSYSASLCWHFEILLSEQVWSPIVCDQWSILHCHRRVVDASCGSYFGQFIASSLFLYILCVKYVCTIKILWKRHQAVCCSTVRASWHSGRCHRTNWTKRFIWKDACGHDLLLCVQSDNKDPTKPVNPLPYYRSGRNNLSCEKSVFVCWFLCFILVVIVTSKWSTSEQIFGNLLGARTFEQKWSRPSV